MKRVKLGEAETYAVLKHMKISWNSNNILKKINYISRHFLYQIYT